MANVALLTVDQYRRLPSVLANSLSRSPPVPLSSMCVNRLLRSVEMDIIPGKFLSRTFTHIRLHSVIFNSHLFTFE